MADIDITSGEVIHSTGKKVIGNSVSEDDVDQRLSTLEKADQAIDNFGQALDDTLEKTSQDILNGIKNIFQSRCGFLIHIYFATYHHTFP